MNPETDKQYLTRIEQQLLDWKQRAEKAEACVAEMRVVLHDAEREMAKYNFLFARALYTARTSSDCGKGWLSPEQYHQLQRNVADVVKCAACAEHIFCGSSSVAHTCLKGGMPR